VVQAGNTRTAIEFFSGIGGFAAVAAGVGIEIVQAFDQDQSANLVYSANFLKTPDSTNLDSIKSSRLSKADLWWLSPPCTPYTSRGAKQDLADTRSVSLVNVLDMMVECKPSTVVIENVLGFLQSDAHRLVERTLNKHDYVLHTLLLCSSDFGIPMRRPRVFLCAFKIPTAEKDVKDKSTLSKDIARYYAEQVKPELKQNGQKASVSDFVREANNTALEVKWSEVERYKWCMDIVGLNESGRNVICFTSGYGKAFRSSGSFLQIGEESVRRFSPKEILSLLGFDDGFVLPESISLQKQWKLVGNSLDLRCVRHVLGFVDAIKQRI
jgi:DNA (cytosine-5)-methyltransferase 1